MKKLLLFSLIVLSLTEAKAQAPNAGFEIANSENNNPDKWGNGDYFVMPIDSNCVWTGIDSMNFWSCDAHSGDRSYELRVATYCTLGYGGTLKTRMFAVDTFADMRIPFSGGSPTAFTFYYKFESVGGDMVSPTVDLQLADGTQVAGGAITLTQSTSGWTLATVPLMYFENAVPEFLTMIVKLHNTSTNNCHYGSRFVIDDINIISPASVIPLDNEHQGLQCYPVPSQDILHLSLSRPTIQSVEVVVIDALGKVVIRKELVDLNSGLDIRDLPSGVYSLKLSTATDIFTGRFIK